MRINPGFRSTRLAGTVLLATAGLAALSLLGGAASAGAPAAEEQVRAAFTLAMRVDQGVQVPPVANTADRPSLADFDRQLDEGSRAIHAIFADKPAERVMKGLQNAVESQRASGDHFRILGAGVGDIRFDKVVVAGAGATVHAFVETWCRTQLKQRSTAATGTAKPAWPVDDKWIVMEPHNVLDVTATLAQDRPGHWIVAEYSWTFVGGTGP